ncbi:hypothetical protein [Streptomyces flaveolus]|uniref:hypothetical protein n=1 Tax=Streptomyces flaveolus TaxID=67297 RepID=UPI003408397B
MPDPSTTRLGLYKSKSDGSELVNYTLDIGQNLDKLDLAVGFQACTSTTRPSSPYSGKPIFETDTGRSFYSNGTSPASASWVEIPNSSGTYGGNFALAAGRQLNIGGSGSTATIAVVNSTAATDLISGRVTGDTQSRFILDTDGTHFWGPGGTTAADTNLYRSAANALTTDDSLNVGINLSVAGSASVTGAVSIGGNLSVTGIGQERYVLKPSDTVRNNTSTVADDPHLTATVVAGGVYLVRFVLFVTSADIANTDFKSAWSVPASTTGLKMCHGPTDTAAGFTSRSQTQGRFSGHGYGTTTNYQADTQAIAVLEESIVTVGSAGSITFQWAQTVSNAAAVTVLGSSHMFIRRLA